MGRRTQSLETELLVAAASLNPGPGEVNRAHAAMSRPAAIDWERFVPLARLHGVMPLLYRHLSTGTFDARLVPGPALARLRQEAERAACRSLMLGSELASLLAELGSHGIRVVPLKGPVLAQQLYGSVSLRRINDLDLLVAEQDVDRAAELIVRRGHERKPSLGSATLDSMDREARHYVALRSTTEPYQVELHYYLHQPFGRHRHALATVEDGLEQVSFIGTPVWVMQPEPLLVYLCDHGSKHLWTRIEWIGGIAALLRSGRAFDWGRISELARRHGAEGALEVGLYLARNLFGISTPAVDLTGGRSVRAASRSIVRRLMRDPRTTPGATTKLLYHVRLDASMRTRVARVWSVLFEPTVSERAAIPLPRALSPLYHILRPARLLARRLRWLIGARDHRLPRA